MHKLNTYLLALVTLLILAVGTSWAPVGAEAAQTATVIAASLNARSGPGTGYAKVGVLARGTKLAVISKNQNWYKVTLPSGKKAWVSGQYIKISQSAPGTSTTSAGQVKMAEVTGSVLNIRSGPSTGYLIKEKVVRGDLLTVLGQSNGWLKVKSPDGITGWVSGTLVKIRETQAQTPANSGTASGNLPSGDNVSTSSGNGNTRLAVVTAETANIRQGPGTTYSVLTQAFQGNELQVAGEKEGWYEVQSPGSLGWIAGWLVELKGDVLSSRGGSTGEQLPAGNDPQGTSSGTVPQPGEGVITPPDSGMGDSPGEQTSAISAIIEGVKIETKDRSTLIIFQATAAVSFSSFTLDNPRRLVVDAKGATLVVAEGGNEVVVDHDGLSSIRLGQYTPDTVRMVAEFSEPLRWRSTISDDHTTLNLVISSDPLVGRTIVIDPGHGSIQPGNWTDPGAIGPTNLYERDVVLDIALRVGEILSAGGAEVIYTRTGDTNLDLVGRAMVANDAGADIFVSIHANASYSPSMSGTTTYFYAGGSLAVQRDIRQTLARTVQMELVRALGRRDAGTIEENFSVLRNTVVPSILVETAFISNPEEEKLLADPQFRARVAEGIAQGITIYFSAN
ncbi:MAG: N-acetylmuramoyl-L-alanine amidase [Bacillota bacterium]